MEVPLRTLVAVVAVFQSDGIPTPGAKRSTHEPKFVKVALWSVWSDAATVSASGVLAGDTAQASVWLFPAATA